MLKMFLVREGCRRKKRIMIVVIDRLIAFRLLPFIKRNQKRRDDAMARKGRRRYTKR